MTQLYNVEAFIETLGGIDYFTERGMNEADLAFVLDRMDDTLIMVAVASFPTLATKIGLMNALINMATFFILVGYSLAKLED